MTVSHLRMKIKRAEHVNLLAALYGILGFMAAFIGAAFLPEILIRYVLKAQTMDQVPAYLEYLPVVFITVAFLYFIYALVSTVMRLMQISGWQKEMEAVADSCCVGCDGNCSCDDHGNCACGCEAPMMETDHKEVMTSGSSSAMAQSMKSLNSKKPRARRKSK